MDSVQELQNKVVLGWFRHLHEPYFWGRCDCSHLVWWGHMEAGTWPEQGYMNADEMFHSKKFIHVKFEDRQPGDIVCFGEPGTDFCDHVVGVLNMHTLIGANSGGAPKQGETMAAYMAREAANNAMVKIVRDDYWSSHRIGVLRCPALSSAIVTP